MAEISFAFWNNINVLHDGSGAYVVMNSGDSSREPIIEYDGAGDGRVGAGGRLIWYGLPYYFLGFSIAGEPIVSQSPTGQSSSTYVASDRDLKGQTVSVVLGGTFEFTKP